MDMKTLKSKSRIMRIMGQVMGRYSDTKPKPTVILVISMLAVGEHNG